MPNYTQNYNLSKPLPDEFYDVGVQNTNMDQIDAALSSIKSGSVETEVKSQSYVDFNTLYVSNKVIMYQMKGNASTYYNAPVASNGILISNGIASRTQTYITSDAATIYQRLGTGGWVQLYSTGYKPTASDVGARPDTWTPSASDVGAVPTTRTVNSKALSSNITLTASDVGARASTWTPSASDVGAVPTTRTVNSKALSSNITLTASDVGARSSTWTPSASDVGAVPTTRTVNSKALSSNITLTASDVSALSVADGGTITNAQATTRRVRNTALYSSETNPTTNGEIYWTYS